MDGKLVWGSPQWLYPVAALLLLGIVVVWLAYRAAARGLLLRGIAPALKIAALVGTALILLEPLFHGARPRPGANQFLVVVDTSASLQICEQGSTQSRGALAQQHLADDAAWLVRLTQDFDVRRYAFDTRLHSVRGFQQLEFAGESSQLGAALRSIAERYQSRPVAGVLLLTDGNSTDALPGRGSQGGPPLYPVVLGSDRPQRDVRVERVTVTQANFQAAPVTIQATLAGDEVADEELVVELLDENGERVDKQNTKLRDDGTAHVQFRTRPPSSGLTFYQVRAYAATDPPAENGDWKSSREATTANNLRHALVDQRHGPYRVLYVGGRPNWEFKFLRRSLEPDREVQLTGLIRIAKREPKFEFRGREGESSNPLFRGFENQDAEAVERYDQPVLLRLNVTSPDQLRDGFPKTAEELYDYHALILDDVEADFFTADQMSLVQRFVNHRGGGMLMLGGQESLGEGGYQRTPIGDLLPVYVVPNREEAGDAAPPEGGWRLQLTREGRLQPWVRVRTTEQEEDQRLAAMPSMRTLNPISGIKPGASILMTATSGQGQPQPALAAQNFGRGRAAALLIGDLWRWGLQRPDDAHRADFEHAWQQIVRWLVADVPRRVEVNVRRRADEPDHPVLIEVQVHDPLYQPLDNAQVKLLITSPEGKPLELIAEPSGKTAGLYRVTYIPRLAGRYRAEVNVTGEDGEVLEARTIGWIAEPAAEEFSALRPDRRALEQLARQSGGEVIELEALDSFVGSLPNRKIPVVEPWVYPLWHRWPVLLFVLSCLVGEWTLRRWRGLP